MGGINHEISIIGWGEDHWVVRNSWGTYWGEEGFFRIKMGSNSIGEDGSCTAGIPIV